MAFVGAFFGGRFAGVGAGFDAVGAVGQAGSGFDVDAIGHGGDFVADGQHQAACFKVGFECLQDAFGAAVAVFGKGVPCVFGGVQLVLDGFEFLY